MTLRGGATPAANRSLGIDGEPLDQGRWLTALEFIQPADVGPSASSSIRGMGWRTPV
jgi:hypothetical protein